MLSAGVLRGAAALTGDNERAWRVVQLLSVGFSVAALLLSWQILGLAGARDLGPRACAFAVLVFLPREVYTAVFISNDAMADFAVTLAIFVYLKGTGAGARSGDTRWLLALLASAALAGLTKQHGLIVLLLPLAWVAWERAETLRRGEGSPRWGSRAALLGVGLLVVLGDELYKLATTGHLLVSNQHFFDWPSVQRPGSVAATSFFDFRLPTLLREPTLSIATDDSFWTQLFARLWFDYDPKFLVGTRASHALAIAWYLLGAAFSGVWLLGAGVALRRWWRTPRLALAALQLAFLAVPVLQSLRFPYYSSMKATFFLPAVSVSGLLLSFGFERLFRWRVARAAVFCGCALLAVLFLWEYALVREQIRDALLSSLRGGKLWPYPPGWGTR